MLELTPDLVLVIVDRLLGGAGTKMEVKRAITPIEQRLMKPIVERALKNLSTAWSPIHQLTFEMAGFESNPDFVQIAPASEIVIVISFEVKIGEDSFLMNLCYPSFALDEVIARLNVQYYSTVRTSKDKAEAKKNITRHLEQTLLTVHVNLGSTHITISDLLSLEKGDVLVLDNTIEDNLPVFVDNRLKFYGQPGLSNEHVAVKIMDEATE